MPSGNISLYDLFSLHLADPLTGLIEDVTTYAPEFSVVPCVRRPGTVYRVSSRTALPTAAFRHVNNGVTAGKSAYKQILKEMFFLDSPVNIDEAIVKADDRSTGDILSHEQRGSLQSAIITLGSQFYYGTSADPNGFTGLRSQLSGSVQAGATTNSTSAYLVWLNPQGVSFDVGNDGEIASSPPIRQQIVAPSPGSGNIFAWVTNISCFVGLAVKSAYSVWAITGISNASSANYMTDALAADLLSLIPLNRRQGLTWFMNRSCQRTLQKSRTAITNQPAAARNAGPAWSPPPIECEGFPIVVTDSITSTESN
jgi:hypothetical protein